MLIVFAVGVLLLIPSLGWLYALFQRPETGGGGRRGHALNGEDTR
ncbi:hypothetical protein [Streptomyces violaceusniger]